MTRYLIIGAGAVGGAIGGRLARAGREVVLVARGDHLSALQTTGLRLRTPDEDVTCRVRAVAGPEEISLSPDDVFILATKTQQAQAALETWVDAPVAGPDGPIGTAGDHLPIFLASNGVAAESMAQRYFQRVFGVCVWMPTVFLRPGEIIIRSTPRSGLLHLGRVPAPVASEPGDAALLDQVAADLQAANFDAPRPADVMAWKYRKLISNLGNVFQALVAPGGDWKPLVERAEAEARALLDAAGIAYIGDAEERAVRSAGFTMKPVPGVTDDPGGSTWQSLARGTGNVETDYLNGEIVAIAHRMGREAPVNATLSRFARQAAYEGWSPGHFAVDELAPLLS